MYIAIDLIIVAIMAATIIGAARRGLILSLFKLLSTIVSLAVALMFYKELGAFFYDLFVYDGTVKYVQKVVEDIAREAANPLNEEIILSKLPEGIRNAVELMNIDIGEIIEGLAGEPSLIAEKLASELASILSGVVAFAALFFLSLIALGILGFFLDKLSKLPVINETNKILGFAFGVIEAFVLGLVISNIAASFCSAYGAFNEDFAFAQVADKTFVARFFISIYSW